MHNYISIAQIIIAVLLSIGILMQQRGSGLSNVFGGDGNLYTTKRGAEKFIFIGTIILSILFLAVVFAQLLIK